MKSHIVYLIRHTKPDIPKGICYGQSDIGVATSFQQEATETLRKLIALEGLSELASGHIISSPLQRCFLLAEELAKHLHSPQASRIQTDDRLKEMNFGTWEMQQWSAIEEFVLHAWMRDYVNIRPNGGENFRELVERTTTAFYELSAEHSAEHSSNNTPLLLICHSGVIRGILARLLEMPLEKAFSLEIDYGSITGIRVQERHTSVLFVNR
ncbi:MAG: alpha-ribazole phosphatase [Candidatus Kapaibacterium sp.]|nr:MAG: alpha-ribazole phosphatase [Candidatus Kapabacteria bacterium]